MANPDSGSQYQSHGFELPCSFVLHLIRSALVLSGLSLLGLSGAIADTIYVDPGASGANSGTSWANAYTSLQAGLADAAPGDEVWVCQGTYHPGAPGDIEASFVLPAGVQLFGGFDGTEAAPSERDWQANASILSGDLGEDDSFGNPWWNGWNITTPNSKRILLVSGALPGTVVDGFVVSNASGTNTQGAGIFVDGSPIEVRNCTFRRNSSYQAAGTCLGVYGGFATVKNCVFTENWGRFVDGVGIWTGGTAGAQVEDCVFFDNHADAYISNGNGCGIALNGSTASTVVRCEFRSNLAVVWPGVQYPSYGGAIHNFSAPLTVDRCKFYGNHASNGGGVFSWKNAAISNCLFANNTADYGGAISSYAYQSYDLRVTGCTIVNNTAHEVGGIAFGGYVSFNAVVSGCILWGNSDVGGVHSRAQVKEASYSCVQNMWVFLPGEDPIDPEKFPSCTDANPLFILNGLDYRLRHASPCIDAADKDAFDLALALDLDGKARFVDLPYAPNLGNGAGPLPDMGCYEASRMIELPFSFNMMTGALMAGGLAELQASDNQRLRVRPSFAGSRLDPHIAVQTEHSCSITEPSAISFKAELSTSAGPNNFKLQAYNVVANEWEDLAAGSVSTSDLEFSAEVSTNAKRFVSGGRILVRCWIKSMSTNISRSWEGRIDLVSVEIRP